MIQNHITYIFISCHHHHPARLPLEPIVRSQVLNVSKKTGVQNFNPIAITIGLVPEMDDEKELELYNCSVCKHLYIKKCDNFYATLGSDKSVRFIQTPGASVCFRYGQPRQLQTCNVSMCKQV